MSAPVGHTCPDIDKAIEIVEAMKKAAESLDDLSHSRGWSKGGLLEDLRTANDKLRSWGYEQEALVEERDETIKELEARIEELEEKLAEAISLNVA